MIQQIKFFRTLIRVDDTLAAGMRTDGTLVVGISHLICTIPGWNPDQTITIPVEVFPKPLLNEILKGPFPVRFFAAVNIAEDRADHLRFEEFEDVIPLTFAISSFARNRHKPNSGYSYFTGTEEELINLIKENWTNRIPGEGRADLFKVVLVSVSPERFVGTTVKLIPNMVLSSIVQKRQEGEDLFVKAFSTGPADPVNFVKIVLYSAGALLENNGTRSSDAEWEVVAIIASEVEEEPMMPLAMARNWLCKPGGTFANYTPGQFAKAIWYWAGRVSADALRR